jgi:HEPN domain-containing protein
LTKQEHIRYWLTTAAHDLDVADALFASAKYDYCLFLGHLALEKVLKACWVRDNENNQPPPIHNLLTIASETKLQLSTEQKEFLRLVNRFHIEARYPDFKMSFYKLCTHDYSQQQLAAIKEIYQWLLNQV